MSKYHPEWDIQPVLGAAREWIDRCLIKQGSLFGNRALWTPEVLAQAREALGDEPDSSAGSFYDKLEAQMRRASPECRRLVAEMLWVLMLFQSNIRPVKKRESLSMVWGWSGQNLDLANPLLADQVLVGIGNPGIAYNTMRWRELNYVTGLARDMAQRPQGERERITSDRELFEQWIESVAKEGYRQFKPIVRYLAFPDHNERITQMGDRRLILQQYADIDWDASEGMSERELDDAIREVRKKLRDESQESEFDFYEERFANSWRFEAEDEAKRESSEESSDGKEDISSAFAELKGRFLRHFPDFKTFASHADYKAQERNYKDEIVQRFAENVAPALREQRWQAAGRAAIDLLKLPLASDNRKPQNIVGWRYVEFLTRLDANGTEVLGRALGELLDESKQLAPRIDRFVGRLTEAAGPIGAAAQRSITAFYLAASDPTRHLFLKTQEFQRILRVIDDSFQWTSKRLVGADVEDVEAMAHRLFPLLEQEGWAPKDMIDVQSFLWVAATSGNLVAEPETGESPVQDEVPSVPAVAGVALNRILFGPPGSGKTFLTIDRAIEVADPSFNLTNRRRLKHRFDELVRAGRIRFVTFHQSFSYEDFVEGIRAETGSDGQLRYRVAPGVFKQLCDDARSAQLAWARSKEDGTGAAPFVLIIDEINRGNVSRIFGELITLIEESKREGAPEALEVRLPYSREAFSVPSNLYIIGTMNMADRSLAGLDVALRRRFEFEECPSDPAALDHIEVEGVPISALLDVMNRRIELLLDRDHHLGHAMFFGLDVNPDVAALGKIFRTQVIPLLQEYFFEDWQRIAWVLNDHRKSPKHQFLHSSPAESHVLFGPDANVPHGAKSWVTNPDAFDRIESYAGIIDVP